jgi:hypothetical protein
MHEPMDLVAAGEAGVHSLAVLHQPLQQVRGDSDVDRAVVPVREEIDARVPLVPHASGHAEKWTLKQVQGDGKGFELVSFPHSTQPRHAELVSASIVPLALRDDAA